MTAARSIDRGSRTTLTAGEVLVDEATGRRFRVTGFLGKGEMGEVYLAEAEDGGGVVAIKTIPLALIENPKIAIRTGFESKALRELRHPNVVHVHASGVREDGVIFMIMDYLPGMTLRDLRQAKGRIPIVWSLAIVRDACLGLHAIHEHAVHRDVKPANLHFGTDAVVRVLDLGAAKWNRSGMRLTTAGTQLGTPAYMAPELLDESAPVEPQADIWSAGVVLYELLTTRHPYAFEGQLPDSPYELGTRILDDLHVPLRDVAPLCPGYLAQIVDKMLAKDPAERHSSAAEVAEVLTAAMARFAGEHGGIPPLSELAAQTFPGARARRPVEPGSIPRPTVNKAPKHLQSTEPLGDAQARRAQPVALPYLRTEQIPAVRISEPEPPRISDVFPKRQPPVWKAIDDMPAIPPQPQPTSLPVVSPPPMRRRIGSWALLVAVFVLVILAAGTVAVVLGVGR